MRDPTHKESIEEFAKKLDRVPKEIRAMSGVPSAVRKPAMTKFTVVFEQSEIPGTLTAHMLEVDLVAQGPSYEEAFKHLQEAYAMITEHDQRTGHTRSPAPAKYWPSPHIHLDKAGPVTRAEDF